MKRYDTTSKQFPRDPMGFDFTEYMTVAGNYYYETIINKTKGTVTASVIRLSEIPFSDPTDWVSKLDGGLADYVLAIDFMTLGEDK